MNIFNRLKAAFTGRLPFGNSVSVLIGGQLVSNLQNTREYVTNGYMDNAVVYSIISQSARKFASVPVGVYEVVNQDEFKRYKSLMSSNGSATEASFSAAMLARQKALRVVKTHPIQDLLERPNPITGGAAFFEALFGFKMITGAGTGWVNKGGDPDGLPLELWCLPSQDINIVVDRNDILLPAGYQLQTGSIANLRKEDVLYWKYWNPMGHSANGSHLYGLAPLKAGATVATERGKADKTSATMMQNQGAKGVIFANSDRDEGMSEEQRDTLQDRIDQEVNGIRNNNRVALANTKLGYIDLGRSSPDLGMEAAKRMSKEDLCNVFGYPPVLLDPSKGTLANLDASIKHFITNKIIPEWCGLRDDLNAWLPPMYKDKQKIWIEPDFTAIPEMRQDLEKMVNSILKIWPLTPNQMLEALGWETDAKDPAMNKRYIPSNLIPLDQVNSMGLDIEGELKMLGNYGITDY